jgi:hypothetical protein
MNNQTLHALNILEDISAIEQGFTLFSSMNSYAEFQQFVGELIAHMNVLVLNTEYVTIDNIEWLTLSTDFISLKFESIDVEITFEYTCSYSTKCIYLRQNQRHMIKINHKICKLDEAIELLLTML